MFQTVSTPLFSVRSGTEKQKTGLLGRFFNAGMAGVAGLEPVTSAVTGQRSNQLSYTPAFRGAAPLIARGPESSKRKHRNPSFDSSSSIFASRGFPAEPGNCESRIHPGPNHVPKLTTQSTGARRKNEIAVARSTKEFSVVGRHWVGCSVRRSKRGRSPSLGAFLCPANAGQRPGCDAGDTGISPPRETELRGHPVLGAIGRPIDE